MLLIISLVFARDGVLDLHFDAFALFAGHGVHHDDAFDKGAQDFCFQMVEIRVSLNVLHECFNVNRKQLFIILAY